MESTAGRLAIGLAALVILWVGVFWVYEPARDGPGRAGTVGFVDPPAAMSERFPDAPAAVRSEVQRTLDATPPVLAKPLAQTKPALEPSPAKREAGVVAPEFDSYTVKSGETFEAIAKARYGSSRLAGAIKNANPLKDPRRLRAGDVIRLPRDPSNIQGKQGSTPSVKALGTAYIVKSGDSLSTISQSQYGTSKHWNLIYEANKGVLPSPDKVRQGIRLVIPPKPAD
jgi:nucleoid-associated protein YgaU